MVTSNDGKGTGPKPASDAGKPAAQPEDAARSRRSVGQGTRRDLTRSINVVLGATRE